MRRRGLLAQAEGDGTRRRVAVVSLISMVPTKDDLVINRGMSRKLRPAVPPTLLAAADGVSE